jgi:hypothetical protein
MVKTNVVVCVDYTDEVEGKLRVVINIALGMKHTPPGIKALDSTNPQYTALKRKLNTIAFLTRVIHKELESLRAASDVIE